MKRLALALVLLAGCASEAARRDDAPIPVRTVELPPEVAGTDPHRPGGPFDLNPNQTYGEFPDGGLIDPHARPPELPSSFETVPVNGSVDHPGPPGPFTH